MRYLSVAVATLGLLTAGGDAATSTPRDASATPSASPYSDSVYVKNPHFLNHLEYFTSTGQVSWIENGWNEDDIGGGAAQLEGEASGGDVDETESGIEKRQMTNTSISTTVKNLTPNQPYTFRFSYQLQSASPANSCRLRAYFANNNYYNSDLWPLTTNPQTNWTVIAATVTPTATSGTLTISVDCTARGNAQIWVDNISVTQGALATSTTTSTTPTSTSTETPSATVDSTILILAKDETTAKLGSDGLLAYGIPFQHHIVPQAGVDLPVLNDTLTHGRFGGIIVMSAVSYDYGTGIGWRSAITDAQWASVYAYQSTFNVRLVRIDEYPGPSTGTTPAAGGCCDSTVDQKVYFTDTSSFPSAGLVTNAQVITTGLYHVPASITDASTTRQVAAFTAVSGNAGGVAGVINNFNGREQFVWFTTWAPSWSMTSSWLQHAHIHWMTRGVFVGKRKIFLNAQIDDVSLSTEIYYPPGTPDVRISTVDLQAHVDWQASINARMPAGSDFWLELGHNGNGDIINATGVDTKNICIPNDAVDWVLDTEAPHEWRKPLGTGTDVWPADKEVYSWSLACALLDPFTKWFTNINNLNKFGHISHTFSHLNLNNCTYHDTKREIQFNQAWMKQIGIDKAKRFTGNGFIPPQITGIYNGDSLQALKDNGITHCVGDNTRPQTRNPNSVYWPLITNFATNGFDGMVVIPRFASRIYYNCHSPLCTLTEWINTSAGTGDFNNLLKIEKESTVRNMLAFMSDPYMFHQANMYTTGNDILTIGDQTRRMSLVMAWTETVAQELYRITTWPVRTQTQAEMALYFLARKAVDDCTPNMSYVWSQDGKSIISVVVTANGNTCASPIPVTIPAGNVTASGGTFTSDVVGKEPPIMWVTLNGSPVTLTLSTKVAASSNSTTSP
ncbi:unnamed protein product [Clonostachys chloroleuca]|uniref:Extracellular serine-rich protein n=1 Tax=Clonostachys chloroleuca TaxID=1926264 RepID=A0AA35Q9U7_9HYPO|nr:unnamed protein product [Clonostachys chloroleuca]